MVPADEQVEVRRRRGSAAHERLPSSATIAGSGPAAPGSRRGSRAFRAAGARRRTRSPEGQPAAPRHRRTASTSPADAPTTITSRLADSLVYPRQSPPLSSPMAVTSGKRQRALSSQRESRAGTCATGHRLARNLVYQVMALPWCCLAGALGRTWMCAGGRYPGWHPSTTCSSSASASPPAASRRWRACSGRCRRTPGWPSSSWRTSPRTRRASSTRSSAGSRRCRCGPRTAWRWSRTTSTSSPPDTGSR